MTYFSRLTDIVTCNLTELLSTRKDPQKALREIVAEMEEGLAGAQRSVATAHASVQRIQEEIAEHERQAESWIGKAKAALAAGHDDQARLALVRKQEAADVVAGLEQQHQAARSTHEHLSTMHRALEARIAEARRKLQHLETGGTAEYDDATTDDGGAGLNLDSARARQIDEELEALRAELR